MLLLYCISNIICLLSITRRFIIQKNRVIEQVQNIEVRSCTESEIESPKTLHAFISYICLPMAKKSAKSGLQPCDDLTWNHPKIIYYKTNKIMFI